MATVCLILSYASSLLLAVGVVITTINVILRYVFAAPWDWADELTTLTLVGLVLLVLPLIEARSGHLRVDILERSLGKRGRDIVRWVQWSLTVALSGFLVYVGLQVSVANFRLGSETVALGVPLWLSYGVVPVSFLFAGLARLVLGIMRPKERIS
jgi:TRAP-type C4-dicarboxylate transport system permease small subunit